jgi:hypothetical protein
MSRELLFRAWTGKTMMYQDRQYLGSFIRRVVIQVLMDHDFPEAMKRKSYLPKGTKIDDYLMQYINNEDICGKKIYDEDIVMLRGSNYPTRYQVYWNVDQWDVKDAQGNGYDRGYYESGSINWRSGLEVIGNMRETPNLLNN